MTQEIYMCVPTRALLFRSSFYRYKKDMARRCDQAVLRLS